MPSGSKTSSSRISAELDDDPDLDARLPQTLGLGLQVVDLDVRDAVLARLALREPDLHPAALGRHPVLLGVVEQLAEAKRLAVEAPRRVEVADVVPDRRRHS